MNAQNELRQAIELMQDGAVAPAAEMLNRLVEDASLDARGMAAAYVWLAESRADRAFKLRCLERALAHDPQNQQIRQGLQQLKSAPSQPGQLPAMGAERRNSQLNETPAVLGVVGGLNGLASGVFVDGGGIVATTSYAIGGADGVTVRLDAERQAVGAVLRRYPTHDLALIRTALRPARQPAILPSSMIAEHSVIVALGFGGLRLRGALARFKSRRARHWLRTSIPPAQLPDAGGNPLYDENGQLLGLLTRNVDAAGNALALKMSQVLALAEQLRRERQLMPDSLVCPACGSLSRARLYGGAHCETCGAAGGDGPLYPPQTEKLAALYREDAGIPCPHCRARVGDYAGRCLRCGQAMKSGAAAEA